MPAAHAEDLFLCTVADRVVSSLCPVSVALPVSVFNLISTAQKNVTDHHPAWEHPGNENAIRTESAGTAGEGSGTLKEDVVIEDSSISEHLAESQAAMEVTSLWSWKKQFR